MSGIDDFQYVAQSTINMEINKVLKDHEPRGSSRSDFAGLGFSENSNPSEEKDGDGSNKDGGGQQQDHENAT